MKKEIHPSYVEARVICSCGETFATRSTKPTLRVEICSKCHPFFTGKQKFVDSGGRVERFQKKYGMSSKKAAESTEEKGTPEEASEKTSQEGEVKDKSAEVETTSEDEAQQSSPKESADTPEKEKEEPSSENSSQPESKEAGPT